MASRLFATLEAIGVSAQSPWRALEIAWYQPVTGGAVPAALGACAAWSRAADRPGAEVDETYIGGEEPGLRGGRQKGKKSLVGVLRGSASPRGSGGAGWRSPPGPRRRRCSSSLTAHGAGHHGRHRRVARLVRHRGLGCTRERCRSAPPDGAVKTPFRVLCLARHWVASPPYDGCRYPPGLRRRGAPAELPGRVRLPLQPPQILQSGARVPPRPGLPLGHEPVRYRASVVDPQPKRKPPAGPGWLGSSAFARASSANRPWRAASTCVGPPGGVPLANLWARVP